MSPFQELADRLSQDKSDVVAALPAIDVSPIAEPDWPEPPVPDEPELPGVLYLIELILKRGVRLEQLIRRPAMQTLLLPRFLAIGLLGFVFFGVALSLVFTAAGTWPQLTGVRDFMQTGSTGSRALVTFIASEDRAGRWLDGSALKLIAGYALGLIAATGICLPSLYFYSLLAGVRMSMADVVIQSVKSQTTAAVALVGILPIYAALGLAMVIFDTPPVLRIPTFWLGLSLPFLAGLFGTYLYRGLAGFADTLPPDKINRRACFLRRLVLSWSVCYTAITPLMIHTLWFSLADGH